eukprot:EG_transcript_13068
MAPNFFGSTLILERSNDSLNSLDTSSDAISEAQSLPSFSMRNTPTSSLPVSPTSLAPTSQIHWNRGSATHLPPPPEIWGWCINLDRRMDRMKAMQVRAATARVRLVRHKAVNPAAGDVVEPADVCAEWDTTVNAMFDRSYMPGCQLKMTAGELGCAGSHVQLWKKAQSANLPFAMILEDDIEFQFSFDKFLLYYLARLPRDWDLMYLDHKHGYIPKRHNKNFYKAVYTWSTGAYVVSKQGYAKLLENLPVDGPVDNFLAKRCLNGTLNAYVPDLTVTLGPIGAAAQLCGQVLEHGSDIEHSTTAWDPSVPAPSPSPLFGAHSVPPHTPRGLLHPGSPSVPQHA